MSGVEVEEGTACPPQEARSVAVNSMINSVFRMLFIFTSKWILLYCPKPVKSLLAMIIFSKHGRIISISRLSFNAKHAFSLRSG